MPTISAKDTADIRKKNQDNLKKVDSGGTINFKQMHQLIMIGDGHKPEHVAFLQNPQEGTITVKREKFIGKGKLYCKGATGGRLQFQDEMARISKKEVIWE
jgi:hypothetical protein